MKTDIDWDSVYKHLENGKATGKIFIYIVSSNENGESSHLLGNMGYSYIEYLGIMKLLDVSYTRNEILNTLAETKEKGDKEALK